MKHVDEWLDEPPRDERERQAKEFLEYCRRPASAQDPLWRQYRILTCFYRGEWYRCTGASRLGDVFLRVDFDRWLGYDLRVDVAECSGWHLTCHQDKQPPDAWSRRMAARRTPPPDAP